MIAREHLPGEVRVARVKGAAGQPASPPDRQTANAAPRPSSSNSGAGLPNCRPLLPGFYNLHWKVRRVQGQCLLDAQAIGGSSRAWPAACGLVRQLALRPTMPVLPGGRH